MLGQGLGEHLAIFSAILMVAVLIIKGATHHAIARIHYT